VPCFVFTYCFYIQFSNQSDVGIGVSSSTSYSVEPTCLYDLMEINEKMTSFHEKTIGSFQGQKSY
jgi:hypothetical protein